MDSVKITYLGHACFCLEAEGYRTVIDPYNQMVPGVPELHVCAEAVYCSHQHGDHNNVRAVELEQSKGPAPYCVTEIETHHDDQGGALRGMNQVRIFDFGGLRVAHMGDLGRMLTPEELKIMGSIDCMMIPVGGFYTIDAATAKQVVEAVKPRVTIPMHYRTDKAGLSNIAHINDFTSLFDGVVFGGTTFCLTEETPHQVLVLECEKGE